MKSGMHAAITKARNPSVNVHGVASATLAALIDASIDDESAIRAEISSMLAQLESTAAAHGATTIHTMLLGCTHYPIVMDIFRSLAPHIEFIDPAHLQAQAVLSLVGASRRELDAEREEHSATGVETGAKRALSSGSSLEVLTSGSFDAYRAMFARLGIPQPRRILKLAE